MPFLLIAIRKNKWDEAGIQYHGAPDVSSDCLSDLRTAGKELSAWLVDDEQLNLKRVLIALAATRQSVSQVDYVIFDFNLPAQFNIKLRKSDGQTPDAEANRRWHYDLTDLSARQLADLAVEIQRSGTTDRLREKLVRPLIIQGVGSGELDKMRVHPKLAAKLFPLRGNGLTVRMLIRRHWTEWREFFGL